MTKTDARDRAERALAASSTARYGIWTDSETKPGTVIVGLAVRGIGSCLLRVAESEWDGTRVLPALGIEA